MGIMEKNMETMIVSWGYILGMTEKKMESIVSLSPPPASILH